MTFQIANVTKPLGAVRAMLGAGNKVVFDIWRPKFAGNQGGMVNTGRYQALMEKGDNGNEVFAEQAGLG